MIDSGADSNELAVLRAIMPPPARGGDPLDWDGLHHEVGVKFPSDYIGFVNVYGGGTVDDALYILPLAKDVKAWRQEYLAASENLLFGDTESALGLSIDQPEQAAGLLVPWGFTPTADVAYWLASDEDPERWNIVVYKNRASEPWRKFDMGFVRFMEEILSGRLDNPFAIEFPIRLGAADYLNWQDRNLLADNGIFVSGYTERPREFFAQMTRAGFDPVLFFPSAAPGLGAKS